MVDQFDNCEFWLPLELLTDVDFAFHLKQSEVDKEEEMKCGSDSFGSSLTNSEMGSIESESDEDDYITGLTRKMPNSTLQENCYTRENNKGCRLSTSPKSPLCKAAGEFRRRQMVQESVGLLPSRNEINLPDVQPGPKFEYPTNHPPQSSYQQFQSVRFEQTRRIQLINQTQQNTGVKIGEHIPIGLPYPARPPLQRSQPGTGMRSQPGTGVFLPRTLPSTRNGKNIPASTPVLIPDRVVQSLNLNMERLALHNQAHPGYSNNNGFSADNGAALNYNNKIKKNHVNAQQPPSPARVEPENPEVIRLPPEWIY